MKRLVAVTALVVLAVWATPASIGGAQAAGEANLIITHADTFDFPGATNPITVCVNGADPQVMEVTDQYDVEEPAPGSVEVTVFNSDTSDCTGTPDQSITVPLVEDQLQGLVIGWNTLFTFVYDTDCVEAGKARIMLAQAADFAADSTVDVYAQSEVTGTRVAVATGFALGTTTFGPLLDADTYEFQVFPTGANPDGPPLAVISNLILGEGTQTELFIAGGNDGELGGFIDQQGPEVCDGAEPPVETTTTTQATTTTAPPVVAPAATAATPVTGTSTYTG